MFAKTRHDVLVSMQLCKNLVVSAKDEEEALAVAGAAAEQGCIAPFSIESDLVQGSEDFDDLTSYDDPDFDDDALIDDLHELAGVADHARETQRRLEEAGDVSDKWVVMLVRFCERHFKVRASSYDDAVAQARSAYKAGRIVFTDADITEGEDGFDYDVCRLETALAEGMVDEADLIYL